MSLYKAVVLFLDKYLSKASATSGVRTTSTVPFTSTMAVVLVWATGWSRVHSSVNVSSSVLSIIFLSNGVYGVLYSLTRKANI